MKGLRIGVVGVGHLGRIHAQKIKAMPGVQLVGVADPVESNRRQVSHDCNAVGFADYRELAGKIEAAVVAAPTSLHHAIGMELLDRGIHVLMEKPLAMNLAESDALVRAARQKSVVLQVGHVERFNPGYTSALHHVQDPKFIEAARLAGFSGRSSDVGAVMDLMIHDIDLTLSLVRSPVRQIEALGVAVIGKHEDAAHARLVFENGCVANLTASRISYQSARTMQIWSQAGFVAVDFSNRCAKVVHPSEQVIERRFDVAQLSSEDKQRLKDQLFVEPLPLEQLQPEPRDAIVAELLDFVESIRRARPPRVGGEQARDAIAVAEQILHKIDQHLWDGRVDGRTGPQLKPGHNVIPAPHWDRMPNILPLPRKEAG